MTKKILSVSELTSYLKEFFERDSRLSNLWLRGEVSNLSKSSSGHLYFTLKDNKSLISCVFFKKNLNSNSINLEDGLQIITRGNLGIHEKSGRYQLFIKEAFSCGKGSAESALKELKYRLSHEGFFDFKYKKSLPLYPEKIGVITSSSSSALEDIISIIKEKKFGVSLYIKSVSVQGENSAAEMSDAIDYFNKYHLPDIIILARGGGSFEELSSFNAEIVAQAIFNSDIPIVSAVGHETDYTIADFVSDLRAPTPSAAANLIMPDIETLEKTVNNYLLKLNKTLKFFLRTKESDFNYKKVELKNSLLKKISEKENSFNSSVRALNTLNPLKVLDRGFSISYSENKKIIKDYKEVQPGDKINVILAKGKIKCCVEKSEENKDGF